MEKVKQLSFDGDTYQLSISYDNLVTIDYNNVFNDTDYNNEDSDKDKIKEEEYSVAKLMIEVIKDTDFSFSKNYNFKNLLCDAFKISYNMDSIVSNVHWFKYRAIRNESLHTKSLCLEFLNYIISIGDDIKISHYDYINRMQRIKENRKKMQSLSFQLRSLVSKQHYGSDNRTVYELICFLLNEKPVNSIFPKKRKKLRIYHIMQITGWDDKNIAEMVISESKNNTGNDICNAISRAVFLNNIQDIHI